MTNDGRLLNVPTANLVQGSQVPATTGPRKSGNVLPQGGLPDGNRLAPKSDLHAQLTLLNKFLNDSGRAAQFRASADARAVQEINPATGAVVAEYPAAEFAALARSVGMPGGIIDELA